MKDFDEWMNVAKYIPSNPLILTRLAQVNKTFYRIFMSDTLWAPLNIYNVEKRISMHYLAATKYYRQEQKDALASARNELSERTVICRCNGCAESYEVDGETVFVSGYRRSIRQAKCTLCKYLRALNPTVEPPPYCYLLLVLNYPGFFGSRQVTDEPTRKVLVHSCGLHKYATQDEKADRDVVLKAVQNDGLQLKFATDELKDDEAIVSAAMWNNLQSIDHATPKCRSKVYLLDMYLTRRNVGVPLLEHLLD